MSKRELLKELNKLVEEATAEGVPLMELLKEVEVVPTRPDFNPFYPASIYDQEGDCQVLMRPIYWGRPHSEARAAFDIGGYDSTLDNGQMVWKFSEHVQTQVAVRLKDPASFVATPGYFGAVHLTAQIEIASDGSDMIVKVFAWDSAGNRATERIPFSWWCRVGYELCG